MSKLNPMSKVARSRFGREPSSFLQSASTRRRLRRYLSSVVGALLFVTITSGIPASPPAGATPPKKFVAIVRTQDGNGYWLVDKKGDVEAFGDAVFYGDLKGLGVTNVVGIAAIRPTARVTAGDGLVH